jgi:autoinducer 2-degrading protein
MYAVVVNLKVRRDRLDEFHDGIRANAASSLADEEGCLRFDVLRVSGTEDEFRLYELYADERAFTEGHRNAPHFARWRQVAERCLVQGGQVTTLCRPLDEGTVRG